MRYRLRTLLTQFSIRDLLWLILLAAIVSYAYRDRLAMQRRVARIAAENEADKACLRQSVEQFVGKVQSSIAEMQSIYERRLQDARPLGRGSLEKWPLSSDEELDPSFPIYYPPISAPD